MVQGEEGRKIGRGKITEYMATAKANILLWVHCDLAGGWVCHFLAM